MNTGTRDFEHLARVFSALGHPERLAIFDRLRVRAIDCGDGEDGMCVCDIAGGSRITLSTVSHHLKLLKAADLVRCEKRGQRVFCRVNPEALEWVTAFARGAAGATAKRAARR